MKRAVQDGFGEVARGLTKRVRDGVKGRTPAGVTLAGQTSMLPGDSQKLAIERASAAAFHLVTCRPRRESARRPANAICPPERDEHRRRQRT